MCYSRGIAFVGVDDAACGVLKGYKEAEKFGEGHDGGGGGRVGGGSSGGGSGSMRR